MADEIPVAAESEESKCIRLLEEMIAAQDCDGLRGEDAIEALAYLLAICSAEGHRLLETIGKLAGMRDGKKVGWRFKALKEALDVRISEIRGALTGSAEYEVHQHQLYRIVTGEKGKKLRILLASFTAYITKRITYLGGEERKPSFELEVTGINPRTTDLEKRTLMLSSTEFDRMAWPIDYLPSGWDIAPGKVNQELVKHAIRQLSAPITQERQVYTHLGWVKLSETRGETEREYWAYLHAGGAIGAAGPLPLETDLSKTDLSKYSLPAPPTGQQLVEHIHKVLEFQELAADDRPNSHGLAAVCLSLPWRAAFDSCAFSVLFVGQSGARKTTAAQLILNHFADYFTYGRRPNAPATWTSSEPMLRRLLCNCKDSILLIDDDARGRRDDQAIDKVTKVLQAQGNGRARQVMSQLTHEEGVAYDPRGVILSTHEDTIANYASLGRSLLVLLGKHNRETMHMPTVSKLQQYNQQGVFTGVMAAYVQWLAGCRDSLLAQHISQVQNLAQSLTTSTYGTHERMAEILAELIMGAQYFLRFAEDREALTEVQNKEWLRRISQGLLSLIGEQRIQQTDLDDAERFLQIIRDLLATDRAYIEGKDRKAPEGFEEVFGWQRSLFGKDWTTALNAIRLGILVDGCVHIFSGTAYEQAQAIARKQGSELRPESTIFNALLDRSVLIPHKGGRATGRKKINQQDFYGLLQLPLSVFTDSAGVPQRAPACPASGLA